MSYIYKITSPSGKIYIGQSTISEHKKKQSYKFAARNAEHNNRYIINAIKKYGWENMIFEVIQYCTGSNKQELDDIETNWITELNCRNRKIGYNITAGGEGVDSETASKLATRYYNNQTLEQKVKRAMSCSAGQKKRYKKSTDTNETRNKKSIAHRGEYLIESPNGKQWRTTAGLTKFAEEFADETGVGYWVLFGAYRRGYTNKERKRLPNKAANSWKVTRLDV